MMSFDEWLASLRVGEPDEGGQVGTRVAGAMDFLREVYQREGPIRPDQSHAEAQRREVDLAEKATPLVLADIRRTTSLNPEIEVRNLILGSEEGQGPSPVTALCFDGSYTTTVLSLRAPEIICDVADNLRDHVVDELHTVWPVCPADGHGLDPTAIDGRAVWHCRVLDHVAAEVGRLHHGI